MVKSGDVELEELEDLEWRDESAGAMRCAATACDATGMAGWWMDEWVKAEKLGPCEEVPWYLTPKPGGGSPRAPCLASAASPDRPMASTD